MDRGRIGGDLTRGVARDWSEWLAMPVVDGRVKGLLVADALRVVCTDAFDFAMPFVADNDLPGELRTLVARGAITRERRRASFILRSTRSRPMRARAAAHARFQRGIKPSDD
ncbi:hypothetical protein [Burkholderia vietnamiensis]|uniref:hypothetical protein n=1 Tax=Burkholderia vietnamiensis TaxID=60552 RepID=UPI003D15FDAC